MADIAARFDRHEDLQHGAAQAWRILSWAHKGTDAQATAQAAQKVADIADRFARHEGIQHEAAQAWRYLSWAHKDTDAQATAQAAQKVADIAARFDRHEGIQLVAAQAWADTVLAAVRFDNAPLVDRAMNELDELAGLRRPLKQWLPNPIPANGRILVHHQRAKLAVDAWRAQRLDSAG